jgi:outer membrane protein assembly factor BamB
VIAVWLDQVYPDRDLPHHADMRTGVAVAVIAAAVAWGRDGGAQVRSVPDDFGVTCVAPATGAVRWTGRVAKGWPPRLRIADGSLWVSRGDGAAWARHELASGALQARAAPPDVAAAADRRDGFWTTHDAILHDQGGATGTVVTTGAFVDDFEVGDGLLHFTLDRDDGQIYALALATGRLRWVLRPRELVAGFEAGDGSRLERLGDRLLVHAPPALLAVEPRTGAVAWSVRVPALEGRWGPLRAVAAGGAWIVAVDGVIAALDAATGRVAWTVDAGAGGATSPVADATAVCFDRRDEVVVPYERDEAEIARALAITIDGGAPRSVRWIRRAEIPPGALRWPSIELPVVDASAAARLELATVDASLVLDAAPLVAEDRTIYVEVPGAWDRAAVVARGVTEVAAEDGVASSP